MATLQNFDANQVTKSVFDNSKNVLRVLSSSSLVTESFDEINYSYLTSGNGSGKVGMMLYKLSGSTVASIQFTYDSSNRISSVVRL